MFKLWKSRKDTKRLKSLKKEINEAITSLEVVRDETTIGDMTNSKTAVLGRCLDKVNITQIILSLSVIISEMDKEIDDRTRKRQPIFKEVVKKDAL